MKSVVKYHEVSPRLCKVSYELVNILNEIYHANKNWQSTYVCTTIWRSSHRGQLRQNIGLAGETCEAHTRPRCSRRSFVRALLTCRALSKLLSVNIEEFWSFFFSQQSYSQPWCGEVKKPVAHLMVAAQTLANLLPWTLVECLTGRGSTEEIVHYFTLSSSEVHYSKNSTFMLPTLPLAHSVPPRSSLALAPHFWEFRFCGSNKNMASERKRRDSIMMVRPHLRTWRNAWGFLGSAELSETHSIESVTAQLSDGP